MYICLRGKSTEIVWLDVHQIKPMEFNPRIIKDDAFRKLQQSILSDSEFMEIRPILLNKVGEEYFVYAGTQRWRACKDLGWETVPVIIDEDLDEDVVKERMLKDNIHAGVWDDSKLQEFDNSILTSLDISAFKATKLNLGTVEMAGVNNHTPKEKSGATVGFTFNLVFATQEDKKDFEILVKNVENAQSLPIEQVLLKLAKKYV